MKEFGPPGGARVPGAPLRSANDYRPQTKFAKVMFLHLSVSHSVQGGACVAEGACMVGGMCGRGVCMGRGACMAGGGHAWQGGACMAEGNVHGRGACAAGGHAWQGGIHGGGVHGRGCAWQEGMYGRGCACPPPGHYEIRSVNARAVRILLECILVNENVRGNE